MLQRSPELDAAAADKGMVLCGDRHFRVHGHIMAGLIHRTCINGDASRHNHGAGFFDTGSEAPLYKQKIKTGFFNLSAHLRPFASFTVSICLAASILASSSMP